MATKRSLRKIARSAPHHFKSIRDIKKAIESHLKRKSFWGSMFSYGDWYVGITDNHKRRKGEHKHPPDWRQWKAATGASARAIEKHFLNKGMKGDTGGGTNPIYVYVY